MKTILTLPDGSAFDAAFVAAITWGKSRGTDTPAIIRIYSAREPFGLGFNPKPQLDQVHYVPMPSDEAAEGTCRELVNAWIGKALQPQTTA